MPITLGSVYELKLHSHCRDQLGLNVLHYLTKEITTSPPTEAKFAEALEAVFAPVLKPLLSAEASFLGVSVRQIVPIMGLAQTSTLLPGVGTGGAQVLPKQVSGLIKKGTALAGKKNRGRVYIPFPSEIDNDTFGTPNAAYRLLLDAFGFQMISPRSGGPFGGALFLPVLLHRTTPRTVEELNSYFVRPNWANQHRRGDFGRVNAAVVS